MMELNKKTASKVLKLFLRLINYILGYAYRKLENLRLVFFKS